MNPDADLLEPLGLFFGRIDGLHCVYAGKTDDPAMAEIIGTGQTPELAAIAFVRRLQSAMIDGSMVLLRDRSP